MHCGLEEWGILVEGEGAVECRVRNTNAGNVGFCVRYDGCSLDSWVVVAVLRWMV